MRTIFSLILFFIFSISVFSQTTSNSSLSKVALIDTDIFDDKEKGIKILIRATRSYNIEYFEINDLSKQVENIKKEIDSLIVQNKPINEKFIELEKLEAELSKARKAKEKEFNRKYSLIVIPVIEKIKEKLKEFASINNLTVIIERKNVNYLIEGEIEDVTFEFIKFCNDSFDKEIK